MSQTVLAEATVNLVANGVDKFDRDIKKVQKDTEKAGKSMKELTDRILNMGIKVGLVGGSMLAIFGSKAMAGTVEAERLGMAIERFFRVTGDALAPYVRLATDIIQKLTYAFMGLSPQVKNALVVTALIATGIGAAAGAIAVAIPLVKTLAAGIAALGSVIGAIAGGIFASTIGTLAAGILGVGTAILGVGAYIDGVFDSGITGSERFIRAIKFLLDVWTGLKEVATGTLEGIIRLIQPIADFFVDLATSIYNSLKPVLEWIASAFSSVFGSAAKVLGEQLPNEFIGGAENMAKTGSTFVESIIGMFHKLREGWLSVVQFMERTWNKATDNIARGLAKIGEATGFLEKGVGEFLEQDIANNRKREAEEQKKEMDDLIKKNQEAMDAIKKRLEGNRRVAEDFAKPILNALDALRKGAAGGGFKLKLDVNFESLQGTWERLQKAMASDSGAGVEQAQLVQLQQANNNLQQIAGNMGAIARAVPAVGP